MCISAMLNNDLKKMGITRDKQTDYYKKGK